MSARPIREPVTSSAAPPCYPSPLEVVFPLIKDAGMKGVLFYDAGNTWNGGYYVDDLRMTCGAGIRWYSPIGPLRLEYGYVLDRKGLNDDSMGRLEFTIGMFM